MKRVQINVWIPIGDFCMHKDGKCCTFLQNKTSAFDEERSWWCAYSERCVQSNLVYGVKVPRKSCSFAKD